jgi:hypothetical protein
LFKILLQRLPKVLGIGVREGKGEVEEGKGDFPTGKGVFQA